MGWPNFLLAWFKPFQGSVCSHKTKLSTSRRNSGTRRKWKIYNIVFKNTGEINLNVVTVYAPTDPREQIDFISSFSKKIMSNTSSLIIAGDWNTTLNPLDN